MLAWRWRRLRRLCLHPCQEAHLPLSTDKLNTMELRGLREHSEELRLLCNQYNPQVVGVLEYQVRKDKIINLTGFSGITKS